MWLLYVTVTGDCFCWFMYGIAFAALVGGHGTVAALVFALGVLRAIHPYVLARVDRAMAEDS